MAETTLKTLIERFRSKPEWQSADPAVRAEAVLRLPASDHDVVLALAREDADPRVRRHFDTAGIDIDALVATYLAEPVFFGPDFDRASLRDVNTDLFPRDEFDLGRLPP